MKDKIFLADLLESINVTDLKIGQKLKTRIENIAQKYSSIVVDGTDIELKETISLESRESEVYGFYVYEEWIYLLDDSGQDIDPNGVEIDFLEKFIEYVSNEENVRI